MRVSGGHKKRYTASDSAQSAHTNATVEGFNSEPQKDDTTISAHQEEGQPTKASPGADEAVKNKGEHHDVSVDAVMEPGNVPTGLQNSEILKPNEKMDTQRAIGSSRDSIPVSMQGFDLPDQKSGKTAPHMRVPASPPSAPSAMSNLDDLQTETASPRQKETVRMRQTSQGWMEVDEKEHMAEQDASDTKQAEGRTMQEENKSEPTATEEKNEGLNVHTSPSSWQAYAETTSAGAETSPDFQVSRRV